MDSFVQVLAQDTTDKTDKVDLSAVTEEKRQTKKVEKAKSRLGRNEAILRTTEVRLLSEISKAINYLSKQSARMPRKSPTRLEMKDRLVNLRLEAAVNHAKQEQDRYDQAWEAWDRGGRKGVEPRVDESRSREQWQRLAEDAASLLEEYPRSKNADITMFNMGIAYDFLRREKDSARVFSQLIAKYPNSQKAGDAYYQLGEFYFQRADFRNATNNYRNALKFKQSTTYSWALFRLGWCSYNLGQYQQALAYWKQTVVEATREGGKGVGLKEEALRDMVFAFAELRLIDPAISYYRRNGGEKYIGRFLKLLSDTFSDQGRYAEAINVLKRFQQVEPYDLEGPQTQKDIIGLFYELNRLPNVWQELERFPRLYGPGSRWAMRNSQKKEEVRLAQELVQSQILYYAKLTHKNAQKDNNSRLNAEAIRGYSLYLKYYPKSKEVAEVKYNMADIYYFTKNFREAGRLYREISLLGKEKALIFHPKGKPEDVHKKATDYMLDAYHDQFEPELKVMLKIKPDFKKPPRPISQDAKNLINACAIHQKFYKDDKKATRACDILNTEIYYRSGNKKLALKYLWHIAKTYPGTKEGNEAVENIVSLYADDKKGLERAIAEIRKIPAYRSGKIGGKLKDLEYGVAVDVAKAEKNSCLRAKKYEDLYKKDPKSPDAFKLINNAGVDYIACGKIEEGIAAYMIVIRQFASTPVAKVALLEVAKLSENKFDLPKAAGFYTEFYKKFPKEKEALASLAKACELQAAIDIQSAVNTCLNFAQFDAENAKVVFFRLLRGAFAAGDSARIASLISYMETRMQMNPAEKIIAYSMLLRSGNGQNSYGAQASQVILATYQKSGGNVQGEALRAVGALLFKQAVPSIARFRQFKLKGGSVDTLQASIKQKVDALGSVQQAFDQVLAIKDAYWGVAAFYHLGYARELIADDLENPPQIQGATQAEVVAALAKDAKEARDGANKFYNMALESVQKYIVYNEWAAKALSGLTRNSGKKVSFDDLIVRPDFIGAEVPSNIANAIKSKED
jgi:TolA-binding protein